MPATNEEQYLLELINETRLDPLGAANRYISGYSPLTSPYANIQNAFNAFGVSGPNLLQQFSALSPVQPLAWNDALGSAARTHNAAMIAADQQTHQAPGEADLGARANAAGYSGWNALGENVYAYAETLIHGHAGFQVDWGNGPGGVQSPPGHRQSIMSGAFREIGIGVTAETNGSTQVGPLVITEDFGARFNQGGYVVGVAYNDANANRFYDPGEGAGGLAVSLGGASTASAASGGYALQTAAVGAQTVVFSGAGLASPVSVAVSLVSQGAVKIDILNGAEMRAATSVSVSGPISVIEGVGATGLTLVANGSQTHTLIGTRANDWIDGGSGRDVIDGRAGADFVRALDGDDEVDGGDGNDDVNGNVGIDVVRGGNGDDWVRGGRDADQVFGGPGNDGHVNGNIGDDRVYGGLGDDTVYGGQDQDMLYGEDGADWLSGDLGDDVLTGGAGADRFLFRPGAGVDWVADFNAASGDRIQLSPGVGYTVVEVQGQAVIDLGGGARIGLAGVAPSQMGDWLVVV
jgi:Ca2+-binding RTX toxin-like protein